MSESMALFGALLQGQMPARVPVVVNLLDQGAREMGLSIESYFARAEHVVEGQLRLRKRYGHDVVWGSHYTARFTEMLGARRTIFAPDGSPNVGEMLIKRPSDIERFEVPSDVTDHPAFQIQKETIQRLNAELGGAAPVCAFVVGSFSLPSILMGMEAWLELLLFGPETLKRELLTKCSDFTIKVFHALQDAGAAMISYANPFASIDILSVAQIEKYALEWIERDAEGCGPGGFVYFGGGGRINPTIPMIIERTGIGAFYLHPKDDILDAKNLAAGRALIAAPINDISLIGYDASTVREEVRRIVQTGAPGGGFIFGTLMMPWKIPEENIHAMVDAAHEFGGYSSLGSGDVTA